MITIKHGSIFDSAADVLVCPVNCVGVMGAGLALEFKWRFPEDAYRYGELCRGNALKPGSVACWDGRVAMFATKNHWRNPSRIEWIDTGLGVTNELIEVLELQSIALPQLGCGCGGLDWAEVWPLYEKHLGGLCCDVEVWIHE